MALSRVRCEKNPFLAKDFQNEWDIHMNIDVQKKNPSVGNKTKEGSKTEMLHWKKQKQKQIQIPQSDTNKMLCHFKKQKCV